VTNPDQPARIEHRAERTYTVPATPEEVWEVIATAAGISSWMLPTRLDPRVGGELTIELGNTTLTGVVTDYTPNERFAYEEPWPIGDRPEDVAPDMARWFDTIDVPLSEVFETLPQVSPIATEFLVEAASGGSSTIRVVTSAYGTGADWENEFFAEMVASLNPILDNLTTRFPVPA
jgi:uncharacterized protein YndB with AHSA1/START domain